MKTSTGMEFSTRPNRKVEASILRKSLPLDSFKALYYNHIEMMCKFDMKVTRRKEQIVNAIVQYNGILSTGQAEQLGFSRTFLSACVSEGIIIRTRHGFYSLSSEIEDDIFTLSLSSEKIIFSHETALFLNGISDRTPFEHTLTIPSNACIPPAIKGRCVCHYINPQLHPLGMIRLKTTFGKEVNCYNAERTLCDIIRSRNKLDEETVLAGIKNYAASPRKDLALLGRYAKQMKVFETIKLYMGVLT